MIDLSRKGLPNAIEVDGKLYFIKTDFRIWLNFSKIIKKDYTELFLDDVPDFTEETESQLLLFYINPEVTPNDSSNEDLDENIFDFLLDGSYIYASFMSVYNIDLIDIENLHWHKFLALFRSLPEDSMIKQIISFRSYNPSDSRKKEKDVRVRLKDVWSLKAYKNKEKNSDILKEINDEFYNS